MSKTTVVNISDGETRFDVYIGRQRGPKMWRGGRLLPRSDWANPFKVGSEADGTCEEVIAKYERFLLSGPAERPGGAPSGGASETLEEGVRERLRRWGVPDEEHERAIRAAGFGFLLRGRK